MVRRTLPPGKGGPDVTLILKELQSQAVCFQGLKDFRSLIRWSGNELYKVSDPCSNTTDFMEDKDKQFSP